MGMKEELRIECLEMDATALQRELQSIKVLVNLQNQRNEGLYQDLAKFMDVFVAGGKARDEGYDKAISDVKKRMDRLEQNHLDRWDACVKRIDALDPAYQGIKKDKSIRDLIEKALLNAWGSSKIRSPAFLAGQAAANAKFRAEMDRLPVAPASTRTAGPAFVAWQTYGEKMAGSIGCLFEKAEQEAQFRNAMDSIRCKPTFNYVVNPFERRIGERRIKRVDGQFFKRRADRRKAVKL